ncbi:c-type cytochrome [Conexibacter sp. DBS9H8]|uniref:c-type cytochrome n=1 Tax=Conexibacter sp. DBS9H8 TaxID=2937801 RepID=UPI00200D9456|nr:c-type cytochrome [Conexibacter sp. DBS9H8]
MVPVIIIAVVFTGLAATLFWAAPRGKLAPMTQAMLSQKRGVSLAINATIATVIIGFGFVIPGVLLVANHNRTSAGTNGLKLTAAEVNGRELFGEHCAVCHTLSVASAVGKTGPNLDQLKPSYPLIMNTLANGCLPAPTASEQNETCLGQGVMPADIVQGQDAVDVAKFVAAVAGR